MNTEASYENDLLFNEKPDGSFQPRAIFADTEPTAIE